MSNTAAELPLPDDSPPIARITERAITLRTLGEYLMGSREAILSLAGNSRSLWLGFLFVLSAGFAREYDGEDLWHEPWHLLLPLGASLATSLMLFLLMNTIALVRGVEWKSARYRVFLSLYWMTAPLAWIYAIPVEQFMTAGDATSTNLWLLAAVSAWRVLLMTRVCSVLYGAKFGSCLLPVMLFADSVALVLLSQLDLQIIAMMGGVRLTEAERSLAAAKFLVQFFGLLTWLIWFLGSCGVMLSRSGPWKWSLADLPPSNSVGRPVWWLATAALGIWIFILPWTQPPQQLRGLVERTFRAGQYRKTLDFMSAHRQDEFPRHWSPPPQIGFNRQRPLIVKVIAALEPGDAPWVRTIFFEKLDAALG